ncbi:MarR family winged helix-turn-helix transcriptional regulator [Mycobacterium sp. 48b]|uniref:MarR family winged helix-turn-helix transcriptional regulator n=1 Tax=Mycobacterium sp. 48b TaxID=3400426 RepID=UPI003AAAC076
MTSTESTPADRRTTLEPAVVAGQLQIALLRLWNCHRREEVANNAAGGLPAAQLAVLSELATHGPTRVSDLAASLGVRPPSISVAVNRLMRMDLVTRWPRSVDQREVHVHITVRGHDFHRKTLIEQDTRALSDVVRLSSKDQEALRRALPVLDAVAQAIWNSQRSCRGGQG